VSRLPTQASTLYANNVQKLLASMGSKDGRLVTDLTDDVDAHYGEIRAHLARTGQIIGSNDLWIGVHTRSVGATLMTSNVRGFMRIHDLRVENWASPDTLKGHPHAVHANPTHALSPTFALV
jgi:predicted nucleic acid-binding protein